ncbi:MAG TPA: ATP-binding cassette domain-containing protein [Candidatus Binatia bacterium]|jgi:phospholipid/cholesterol/gamma-HCH transport system ATP-binding protein|nr:ATP-binding cassette domain-containing protein [Candidatus Binatia bacterium]
MIQVERVAIGWDGRAILEDLDFEVAAGDVFVILGGSGCGKSTLLRHLIGLERPLAGTIRVGGEPPGRGGGPPTSGVLFQSGALFGSMTLAENVALPLRKWTRLDARAIDTIVRAKLRLVGLEGFENHVPAETSGGMRKRAGIARALALDPPLLFLDEPSAGLDPVSAVELDELILTLNRSLGMTTVIVSHELESIFKVGRSCIMLDKEARGIIARGDPARLRAESPDPRVQAFFHRRPAPER